MEPQTKPVIPALKKEKKNRSKVALPKVDYLTEEQSIMAATLQRASTSLLQGTDTHPGRTHEGASLGYVLSSKCILTWGTFEVILRIMDSFTSVNAYLLESINGIDLIPLN